MNFGEELKQIREQLGMTLSEFSRRLEIERVRYQSWERGLSRKVPPEIMSKARNMKAKNEVGPFTIPASQLQIPIPFIGEVAASSPMDWTDPFESLAFEYVPPEMGDARGRFSCRVVGDSMYDLLHPGDLCVFQASEVPRLGAVVLHRTHENLVTIKELRHDGTHYVLHALNPAYEETLATGNMVGYLVGIVREQGSRRVTVYDATGIRP